MNSKLNHKPFLTRSLLPGLILFAATGVSAEENAQVTNIPPELLAPAVTPEAQASETPEATELVPEECADVDCIPNERAPEPEKAPEPVRLRAAPPVRIGPPAKAAITQSHDWAENPYAMPVRDTGGRVVFQFSESAPTIVCAPLRVCDIELQPGESVQGAPHIGDGVRWKVGPAVSGSDEHRVTHLIVKPTEAGLDTNLIVPTDRRTYHLRLVSSAQHYVSSVAFDYPEDQQLAWNRLSTSNAASTASNVGDLPSVAVSRLNFNYTIKTVHGKPSFKPLRAMDDGNHTYVTMNNEMPQGEAPVLIGISPDGNEQMINYRLKENMYVVDGTVHKLALISGVGRSQQRVELTRETCEKRGIFGGCRD